MSDFEENVQNHQEASTSTHIKDSAPNMSQHQEMFQDAHPDDETAGSILRYHHAHSQKPLSNHLNIHDFIFIDQMCHHFSSLAHI
jgi:hypothetical protein